ncbi:MAG TPA: hypothetical protein VM077_03720 [Candidatus Limnocylindrales bacterium]|nr:hypothetical protein [Candidatus Limnocylindrales bacterium]
MRGEREPRKRLPILLMSAGLALGVGGGRAALVDSQRKNPATVSETGIQISPLDSDKTSQPSARIELFSGHVMTENAYTENHCTFTVEQQRNTIKQQRNVVTSPGSLVLSFVNARNMENPEISRELEDVKAQIRSIRTPDRILKTVPLHRTVQMRVDGEPEKSPRWEAVTQLKVGEEYIMSVSSRDRSTGDPTVVSYKVVIPKAA